MAEKGKKKQCSAVQCLSIKHSNFISSSNHPATPTLTKWFSHLSLSMSICVCISKAEMLPPILPNLSHGLSWAFSCFFFPIRFLSLSLPSGLCSLILNTFRVEKVSRVPDAHWHCKLSWSKRHFSTLTGWGIAETRLAGSRAFETVQTKLFLIDVYSGSRSQGRKGGKRMEKKERKKGREGVCSRSIVNGARKRNYAMWIRDLIELSLLF